MNHLIEPTISIIITFFAATTAFFAFKTLAKVSTKRKTDLTRTLKKILALIATGYIVWTFAELIWTFTEAIESSIIPPIADVLWTIGYPLIIIAFALLIITFFKQHKQTSNAFALLATLFTLSTLAISTILYTCPAGEDRCIDYIYSTLSITIFIMIVSINTFIAQIPLLATPFSFIGISFFVDFIADVLYATAAAAGTYTAPLAIADSLYALSYLMTTIAFYLLCKKRSIQTVSYLVTTLPITRTKK